jgi:hypothetical protein
MDQTYQFLHRRYQTEISSPSDTEDYVHFSSDIESKNAFNQSELNQLVRDLCLTKEKSQLLGTRLKRKLWLQEKLSIVVEILRNSLKNSS